MSWKKTQGNVWKQLNQQKFLSCKKHSQKFKMQDKSSVLRSNRRISEYKTRLFENTHWKKKEQK
jgi:hypothetical protein